MNVAFLNENTLGHTSYLPRFAAELRRRPELSVTPFVLDALPLPAHLRRLGDTSIRGLRRFGLDVHWTRWRVAISRHVREQLDALRRRERVDALVVNTQSAGLELGSVRQESRRSSASTRPSRSSRRRPGSGLTASRGRCIR